MSHIESIQETLRERKIDGWLFCSFRGSDPFAPRILKLPSQGHSTRRWFCFIPANGVPVKIVHIIEKDKLDAVEGEKAVYLSWQQLHSAIKKALGKSSRVAMQYSPMNDIPYVSCVDAGTVELVRSMGVEVVSSAELIQKFEATLSEFQKKTHIYAAENLRKFVDLTFMEVNRRVSDNIAIGEYDVQQYLLKLFSDHNLVTSSAPVAAVNENTANPHYEPLPNKSKMISAGDFLLIDLWAKKDEPSSVYADITWTAYIGAGIPDKYQNVFSAAKNARSAALDFVKSNVKNGVPIKGFQVDDAARNVIDKAGFGDKFIHRTGHSIGEEVHGTGVNMDNLETRDNRIILPHSCFSIEPGIYLEGDFGVRTEIDVYVDDKEAVCYGQPLQDAIVRILN